MQWVLYIIIFACTLNYWPTDAKKSDTATTKRDHPLTTAHPVTKKSERTKERKNDDQKNQASAKQPNCQRSGKSASNGNRGNSTRSKRSVGEGKNHQELICKPGQAVSSIRFTTKDDGYQVFEIQCLNVTDSENVICEWSIQCRTKKYGANSYVGGMNVLYDRLEKSQPVIFLCCTPNDKPRTGRRKRAECSRELPGTRVRRGLCSQTDSYQCETVKIVQMVPDTASSSENSKCDGDSSFIRSASSSYPQKPVTIYALSCKTTKSYQVKETVPKPAKVDPDLIPTGLAALAGLAGLALIRRQPPVTTTTTTTTTTTPPWPCQCCQSLAPCQPMQLFGNGPPGSRQTIVGPAACAAACMAWTSCMSLEFWYPDNCYLYTYVIGGFQPGGTWGCFGNDCAACVRC